MCLTFWDFCVLQIACRTKTHTKKSRHKNVGTFLSPVSHHVARCTFEEGGVISVSINNCMKRRVCDWSVIPLVPWVFVQEKKGDFGWLLLKSRKSHWSQPEMGSYLDFSCLYSQDIHGFSYFFHIFFDLSTMPQFFNKSHPSKSCCRRCPLSRVQWGTALGVGVVASTVNPAQITDSVSLAWRKKKVCVKESVNLWMKRSFQKSLGILI